MANSVCTGHQTLSAANLASAIGLTIPAGTLSAWLQAKAAPVRVTFDGATTPTAAVGARIVNDLAPLHITNLNALANLSAILESGSPTLEVTYWGLE